MQKAVQQIMLGTVTKTERQAAETLCAIRAAGYEGIELNGFMVRPTSFLVRVLTRAAGMPAGKGGNYDWCALLKNAGLSAVSLHTDLGSLKRDPDAFLKEAETFGTKTGVITGMYRFDYTDPKALGKLCDDLNRAGEALQKGGAELLYHNHNIELQRVGGEAGTAYEFILSHTDPALVNFEFDSYWFSESGADICAWMQKLGSRMRLWHINDRGARLHKTPMTPIVNSDSMELGTGSMPLDDLLEIARSNGVRAVVLESHKNWIDHDPIKSLTLSANWLNERIPS